MKVFFVLEHVVEHVLYGLLCAARVEENARHRRHFEDRRRFRRRIVCAQNDVCIRAAETERIDADVAAGKWRFARHNFECSLLEAARNCEIKFYNRLDSL